MTTRAALKHSTFMSVAVAISKLSTCRRLQVGCVLLGDDGRVLGTGYNGALPGCQHCDDETCGPGKRCLRTRHAERSALDYSQGVVARCYVTHEPCVRCTQDLIARGCREVYYLVGYEGVDDEKTWRQRHVDEAGVRWVQMRRDDGSDGSLTYLRRPGGEAMMKVPTQASRLSQRRQDSDDGQADAFRSGPQLARS